MSDENHPSELLSWPDILRLSESKDHNDVYMALTQARQRFARFLDGQGTTQDTVAAAIREARKKELLSTIQESQALAAIRVRNDQTYFDRTVDTKELREAVHALCAIAAPSDLRQHADVDSDVTPGWVNLIGLAAGLLSQPSVIEALNRASEAMAVRRAELRASTAKLDAEWQAQKKADRARKARNRVIFWIVTLTAIALYVVFVMKS